MNIRKATLNDVKNIQKLVNDFARNELMLPRSLNEIYENVRDFWIIEKEGELIGCCALHTMWEHMAEIKSLAVHKKYQKQDLGKEVVEMCQKEAVELNVKTLFALTFVPEFFEKLGYVRGKKEDMPHKIWSECIKCPHFPDCDEVLVVKHLEEAKD
jgi:amino-acid N-acetyltransferase